MPDRNYSHHSVALVSFGYGDIVLEYSCCRNGATANVDAADFERDLQTSGYFSHRGMAAAQFEGAYVLDMRPAFDRHGPDCVFDGPLLNATLPDEESSPFVECDNPALGELEPSGDLGPVTVNKPNGPRRRGLEFISLGPYIAYWQSLGARVGRIRTRAVEWDEPASASVPSEQPRFGRLNEGSTVDVFNPPDLESTYARPPSVQAGIVRQ